MTWDGHSWNLNNNRLFEARFEKYLSAPAETSAQSQAYQSILNTILDKLAPGQTSTQKVDEAFRLLPRAANFEIDAHLCDALADAVYSVWRAQDASQRLAQANQALEQERKANEWNAQVASQQTKLEVRAFLAEQGRDRGVGQGTAGRARSRRCSLTPRGWPRSWPRSKPTRRRKS